jgi:aminoglycoside phosphotransferase (APT) family kinase protein
MSYNQKELINVRKDEQLDIESLGLYLRNSLKLEFDNLSSLQFSGGHANLTYLLRLDKKEYVLRRPPLGPVAPSAHDMLREHRVQSSLNPLFPLAPKSLYFCDDERIIGSKFHIIERRNGFVIRKEFEPYISPSKDNLRKLSFKIIDVLADLHNINPDEAGLGDLGKPEGFVLRQLNGWEERWKKSTDDKVLKSKFDKLISSLRLSLPHPQAVTILHNDFKLDNIMWSNSDQLDPIAIFDWDMCTRGDPLMDLGHMLNYWIDETDNEDCKLITSMPVNKILYPTRKEIVDYYSKKTGFNVRNINWYYAFGAFKLAVILQQIFYRYQKGQTQDERFSNFGKRIDALINRANNVF